MPSVTDDRAIGSMHLRVAQWGSRLLRISDKRDGGLKGESLLAWAAAQETDPALRASYDEDVDYGWAAIAGVLVFVMLVLGFSARELFGPGAGDAVVVIAAGPIWFCLAGCANVLWRRYWYIPRAKLRLRKHGPDDERFASLMRRALPRNSSIYFQGAVGVLAMVVAAAAL